jgi:hypothetical protein
VGFRVQITGIYKIPYELIFYADRALDVLL